jgi:hypothetical protein
MLVFTISTKPKSDFPQETMGKNKVYGARADWLLYDTKNINNFKQF